MTQEGDKKVLNGYGVLFALCVAKESGKNPSEIIDLLNMTQKDKDLLLKDLCARLPYGVKCHFKYGSAEDDVTLGCIDNNVARFEYGWYGRFHVNIDASYIKPYLRPMSSMTEEERETYYNLCYEEEREEYEFGEWAARIHYHDTIDSIDYLNAHHFDYRGLIPKGLAIEVTKENNPY